MNGLFRAGEITPEIESARSTRIFPATECSLGNIFGRREPLLYLKNDRWVQQSSKGVSRGIVSERASGERIRASVVVQRKTYSHPFSIIRNSS